MYLSRFLGLKMLFRYKMTFLRAKCSKIRSRTKYLQIRAHKLEINMTLYRSLERI